MMLVAPWKCSMKLMKLLMLFLEENIFNINFLMHVIEENHLDL